MLLVTDSRIISCKLFCTEIQLVASFFGPALLKEEMLTKLS